MRLVKCLSQVVAVIALVVTTAQTLRGQSADVVPPLGNAARAPEAFDSSADDAQVRETFPPGLPHYSGISGPASVPAQLQGERAVGPTYRMPGFDDLLQPWFDFKQQVKDEHYFEFGLDYASLYQAADGTLTGEDEAAGGIFRVFGDWTLIGRDTKDTGSIIIKGENRHRYGTTVPPAALGFELGYLGIPGSLFSNVDWVLTPLYWEQYLCDGNVGFVVGRLEPDSFIDVLGYANPWIAHQNFAILLNPTIPFPDVGIGAAGGFRLNDQWSVGGGVYDANAAVTEYEAFEGGAELFSHVELAWSPAPDQRFYKNIRLVGWHVDEREFAGVPESHGIGISANWTFDERWMPFFRAGWSEGEAPFMNRAVTAGLLRYFPYRGDLAGIGLSWEDPADNSLREQNSVELFYRVQLSQNLAVTPSLQLLIDPALNPNDDAIAVFGLRGRVTF